MSASQAIRRRYLESIAEELLSQASRVRYLIGNRHWLTDGHHKEYLLGSVLSRHLPAGVLVSRGFVVSPYENELCSTEQDLLVIDTTREAPLFHQADVAICFPRTVLAAISVKTTLGSTEVLDVVSGLNSVRAVARNDVQPRSIWCGGYFFEVGDAVSNNPRKTYEYLNDSLNASPAIAPILQAQHPHPIGPDALCTARDFFYRVDYGTGIESDGASPIRIFGHRCSGLATAFFIAQILDHVAFMRGLNDSSFCDFADLPGVETLDEDGWLFRP